jgi:spermidine/putrescine-binding protein
MNPLRRPLSRRTVLKLLGASFGAAAAGPILAACGGTQPTTTTTGGAGKVTGPLRALCWEGYTDPTFVRGFEDKYGVKVNSTFIGSNDELVAKLRAGGPQLYDVISPSIDTTKILIDAGLVQPINVENVPNWETVYPVFKENPNVYVGGQVYGVPMCWGVIPLIADLDQIPKPANTWGILWDERYAGRISVWNDISSIYNTALLLGFDNLYTLTDDQLEQVKQKMLEQKPLLRKYWSTAGELTNLFENGEVWVANSFFGLTYTQLTEEGRSMKEWVPEEGATAWVDYWMVVKGSPNAYTAELFINYIHESKVQATINEVTGYGVTNEDSVDSMDPERVKIYHQDDPEFLADLSYWQQVPRRQKYLDVLNEVLAE